MDRDWTIRPGEILKEWIEENHLTVRSTAVACAISAEQLRAVIDGAPITGGIAARLQSGTGIPAFLWIRLEAAYRADLAAGRREFD